MPAPPPERIPSFSIIEDVHTTEASHNDVTFNGFLKSYYLIGAITEPSTYDSTGKASAISDYNTVRITGGDNFRSFGAVAFAGVNNDHTHDEDHSGDHGDQGGNQGDNTHDTDDTHGDEGGDQGGNTDTDDSQSKGDTTQGEEGGIPSEGSGEQTEESRDEEDPSNVVTNFTNVLSSSAYALNDTAAVTALSDTADAQATYTITVSASHNTFDITGGSQVVAVGGVAAVGDTLDKNRSYTASISADDNTLTLHGGTYNANRSLNGDSADSANGDDDEDEEGDGFETLGIAASAVILFGENCESGTISASNNTLVLAVGSDGKSPDFIGNVVLRGSVIVGDTTNFTSVDLTGNTLITDNVKGMKAYNPKMNEKVRLHEEEVLAYLLKIDCFRG